MMRVSFSREKTCFAIAPTLLLTLRPCASFLQVQLDEASVKGLELQLAGLRKETDALNRERKLQQHAAGGAGRGLGVGLTTHSPSGVRQC